MRLISLPGVFRPRRDSWLLAQAVRDVVRSGDRVVDVCTGSGVIAVSAALGGAGHVTAIDISRRAVLAAASNGLVNGVRIHARRGDLLAPAAGMTVDLIASNPPYLPATVGPVRGAARAWEGGRDGRQFIDRLIDAAPALLRPGGILLIIHSSLCGIELTHERMRAVGLLPEVLHRERGPVGPLVAARTTALEALGLLQPGEREEEMAILGARRLDRVPASG
ncbi:MAG TPA: HemK2/MTQ2 family protein methyltransferase [Euzebya sp.]|nr:HemK2/MTQ2 family protein methyltransferase [Euzebya sp.]